MLNLICHHLCPSPFCVSACPIDAISVSSKDNNIYVDTDKCNRCGICSFACQTSSLDKSISGKRPWVSEDWARITR